ncbi:hypothetical protein [Eleftheria terrae]|uniref:hypothetical protein n=1 Tax=Eleftheria terrae TaxID=1597781 RepID=UPI00263BDC07|nr:hypothetical protein [Eleftheria terrae]WKB50781.1 hypothetical protein N7L95_13235 [Eleftheria terrae]
MPSLRERLVLAVIARVSAAVQPVPVLRSPATPVFRDTNAALLLFPESDAVTEHSNGVVTRALTLRLVALARGDDAFAATDHLIVAAHAALLADPNFGGLALAVRELDCEWDSDDTDTGAVAQPARYAIRYRTHTHDLTGSG